MGTRIKKFAEKLYVHLALAYRIAHKRSLHETQILLEKYSENSDEFISHIAVAVMMLSYTYRPAFRKIFRKVLRSASPMVESSIKLFVTLFIRRTYSRHSPFKILVILSLISEIYLYIFFQLPATKSVLTFYVQKAVDCFTSVYKYIKVVDNPILKWQDVKFVAKDITKGFLFHRDFLCSEFPPASVRFSDIVQSVSNRHAAKSSGTKKSTSEEKDGVNASGLEDIRKGSSLQRTSPITPTIYVKFSGTDCGAVAGSTAEASQTLNSYPRVLFGTVDEIVKIVPGFYAAADAVVFESDYFNRRNTSLGNGVDSSDKDINANKSEDINANKSEDINANKSEDINANKSEGRKTCSPDKESNSSRFEGRKTVYGKGKGIRMGSPDKYNDSVSHSDNKYFYKEDFDNFSNLSQDNGSGESAEDTTDSDEECQLFTKGNLNKKLS